MFHEIHPKQALGTWQRADRQISGMQIVSARVSPSDASSLGRLARGQNPSLDSLRSILWICGEDISIHYYASILLL